MGVPNVSNLIPSTMSEDFVDLAHDLWGISLVAVQQWYTLNKLNICMVFAYLSRLVVLMAGRVGRACSHYLNAFYLCLLARYFLAHEIYRVDQRMCLMVNNLNKGSTVGMILAETLNGLDIVHKKEATFFVRSSLLLQV